MQWPIPPFPTRVSVANSVAITTGSTANTKGSWFTLISGIATPGAWISLGGDRITTSGDRAALVDIGIGAAGSETVVAPNLVMGYRPYRNTVFPLHIPAGATVRARASSPLTSDFLRIRTHVFHGEPDGGLSVPGRITAYGVVTATSGGTLVSPSAASNTKGSYVQLTAATTAPIHALMVMVQASASTLSEIEYLIDIAVGASGSETIIMPDFTVRTMADAYIFPRTPEFLPMSLCIPAGVRLSARGLAMNVTSAIAVEVAVYGFSY